MLRYYYTLAKPGLVYGNVFTTVAGFLYGSQLHIVPPLFLATIFGMALVIASACVFNNYLDQDIDQKMARTRDRVLVSGAVSNTSALVYGSALGVVGFLLLYVYVNPLSFWVALFGFFVYVFAYTFLKRVSHFGVIVGSVAGAVPITVGYIAATNQINLASFLLFLILMLWQMPHFYAISIYRMKEYTEAEIPVLPAKKGMRVTKIYIAGYIAAFTVTCVSLSMFGFAGRTYLVVTSIVGIVWLARALQGFRTTDDSKWARGLFFFSLIVIVVFSCVLSVAQLLP